MPRNTSFAAAVEELRSALESVRACFVVLLEHPTNVITSANGSKALQSFRLDAVQFVIPSVLPDRLRATLRTYHEPFTVQLPFLAATSA